MASVPIIAGVVAAGAYVNGKYKLGQDLNTLKTAVSVAIKLRRRVAAKKVSLWYDIEDQVKLSPSRCAIWFRQTPEHAVERLTFQETYDAALRFSQFLSDQGVRPGDLVAAYLLNGPTFIVKTLGCLAIGCAPAEINHNLEGASLIHCLKISGSKILLVDDESGCQARIDAVRAQIEELGMKIIVLDDKTKAAINSLPTVRPGDEYREAVTPSSPAFVFYTSGTTGMPKACGFRTERAYVLGIPRMTGNAVRPGEGWYNPMPLYHGTGCTSAIGCLMSGVTLCLTRRFSTSNFWKDVHDSGASGFVYVGETARYLLAAPESPLDKDHNLKVAFGNGLRPDVWAAVQKRFNIPIIVEFFNSSEGVFALVNLSRNKHYEGVVGSHGGILRFMTRNAYVPVEIDPDDTAKIWRGPDGFAKRASYEEGGEILVKCENQDVFVGYHNNPEATAKKFASNVFKQGDLYYRSGDALRRDNEGRWTFKDRLGDSYRWRSENVSTAEVGEALGEFPLILEANVYGVVVPGHEGRAGCAAVFIHPEKRSTFDWHGLAQHARKRLPKYAVPIFIRVVSEPTPTHNQKQSKVQLRNEGCDLSKIMSGSAPEDQMLWLQPGADTWKPFNQTDYSTLVAGKVRL